MENKLEKIQKLEITIESIKDELIHYCGDKDSMVRNDALELLILFCSDDVTEQLLKSLDDTDEIVKATALEELGYRKDKKYAKKVFKSLNDESWLVRAYAYEALGNMNAVEYISQIENNLVNINNSEELVRVYYALIKLGEEKYFSSLLELLNNDNYRVRCAVANLLYYLSTNENKKNILESLNKALEREITVAGKDSILNAIEQVSR